MATRRQVFISHDTEDAAFAHRVARDLHGAGGQVWIAPDNIQPGESWVDAIERGLKQSTDMVIVLTPAALASQWVKKETEIGIMRERRGQMRLIPLMVQRCDVPLLLSSYQMVSFRQDYDAGMRKLVRMLGLQQPQARSPSVEPSPRLSARSLRDFVIQTRDESGASPSPRVPTRSLPSATAIQERFVGILEELLGIDAESIHGTSRLMDDLDLDELDIVELIMTVEEEWNLEVPDQDVKRGNRYILQTVDDWVTYLARRLRAGGN